MDLLRRKVIDVLVSFNTPKENAIFIESAIAVYCFGETTIPDSEYSIGKYRIHNSWKTLPVLNDRSKQNVVVKLEPNCLCLATLVDDSDLYTRWPVVALQSKSKHEANQYQPILLFGCQVCDNMPEHINTLRQIDLCQNRSICIDEKTIEKQKKECLISNSVSNHSTDEWSDLFPDDTSDVEEIENDDEDCDTDQESDEDIDPLLLNENDENDDENENDEEDEEDDENIEENEEDDEDENDDCTAIEATDFEIDDVIDVGKPDKINENSLRRQSMYKNSNRNNTSQNPTSQSKRKRQPSTRKKKKLALTKTSTQHETNSIFRNYMRTVRIVLLHVKQTNSLRLFDTWESMWRRHTERYCMFTPLLDDIHQLAINKKSWPDEVARYTESIRQQHGILCRWNCELYTCERCGCQRTWVDDEIRRAADEGQITFVRCVQCNHIWRMD